MLRVAGYRRAALTRGLPLQLSGDLLMAAFYLTEVGPDPYRRIRQTLPH